MTNFKMTEIKTQNGCWQKKLDKRMCTWKGTKNLITVPKLYCIAEYWRLGIAMWMASSTKVQTISKYIQFDAWARTGTKRSNAKTDQR